MTVWLWEGLLIFNLGVLEEQNLFFAGLELGRWARLFVSVTMQGNTRSPFDSPLSALGVRSGQALDFARDDMGWGGLNL